MRIEIVDGPEGVDATFYTDDTGEILYVALDPTLDEVTRQRYIAEAKREYGVDEQRRRRGLIPLLPVAWGHAASPHKTAIAVGGGALALGLATTAALVPIMDDDNETRVVRPHAAAPTQPPAPARPHPTAPRRTPPPKTPATPAQPQRSPSDRRPPDVPALHLPSLPRHPSRALPVDDMGSVPAPPQLPSPPAPPRTPPTRARPLLRVDLPPVVHASVRFSPQPQIKVRLGSKQP